MITSLGSGAAGLGSNLLTIYAAVFLETKDYEEGLKKLKSDAEAAGDRMKKGFATAAKIGTAAVVAFGASSLKTGMEFDSAMSQVAATMGTTTDEIQELRDFAKEMGSKTAFSARQAAEALNYMALAGYDAQTSMEMLPKVLDLAAAGGMDLGRASDMITDSQSALGLTLDQTSDLVNQMAAAASKANASVSQLGDAILTVGGTAKTMKGGTVELNTVLGLLADNGVKGAEGGTALRNIILSLSAPTDAAAKKLKELGVQVLDETGNMRGFKDIFADLNASMGNLADGQKTQVLSEIFNKVDLKSVNALMNTNLDRWDQLTGAIEASEGAASKMAETQLDNLAGNITLLKSAFEGLQIAVAEKLMPAANLFIKALIKVVEHMDILGPIIAGLTVAFTTFAIAINITKIIRAATIAMAAFNAVLVANPIGLMAAAVAGLVTVMVLFLAKLRSFLAGNEAIQAKVKAASEAIKAWVSGLPVKVTAAFDAVKTAVLDLAERIGEFFTKTIPEKGEAFGEWLSTLPETAVYWLGVLIGRFARFWVDVYQTSLEMGSNAINAIVGFFATLPERLLTWFLATQEKVAAFAETTKEMLKTGAKNAVEATVAFFRELPGKIGQFLKNTVDRVAQFVSDLGTKIKTEVPKKTAQLLQFFKELPGKIKEIGAEMITELWEGFQEKWSSFVESVKERVDTFVAGIKEGLSGTSQTASLPTVNSAQARGSSYGGRSAGNQGTENIVINLTAAMDGAAVARQTYTHNRNESIRQGTSMIR